MQLPVPRPYSGPFGQARLWACGMLAVICRLESSALARASAGPCNTTGFCLGSPIGRRCKASLLGLPADMPRTRRVPGNSPAALEQASGRWSPKGRRRGALPLAALAGPAALGARGPCDTPNGGLAGWRVGDARDLTRSRGFAAANPDGRLHLPASVVEVYVAARRLRRIVPLGIRPQWDDSA